MATLFDRLAPWMAAMTQRVGGRPVTYTRGGTRASVTATPGQDVMPSELVDGVVILTADRDYLIDAADLAQFGEPQIGDRITETLNGVAEVYEVKTPGTGRRAWEWHDGADRTTYRLHTMRVI